MPLEVGRAPGYGYILTTPLGSRYRGLPGLSSSFTSGKLLLGGWVNSFDGSLRFWVTLRMWVRRARQTVYNRALVRYHTGPSLLGTRRRDDSDSQRKLRRLVQKAYYVDDHKQAFSTLTSDLIGVTYMS